MAATDTTLKPYVAAENGEMVRVTLVGLLAGIAVLVLATLVSQALIKPLFCGGGQTTTGVCTADGVVIAYHIASILVGLSTVALFANWGVFRPLPLVIAVTVALWGYQAHFGALSSNSRVEFYVFLAILSTLCYALFYWLMRLRNFPISMLLSAAAMVGIYWVLNS